MDVENFEDKVPGTYAVSMEDIYFHPFEVLISNGTTPECQINNET